MRATTTIPVRFWLKTDSDVVMQIVKEAKRLPELTQDYVKSQQQDGKKQKKDLTQPEIYNIDSNKLATKMRYEMVHPASKVIIFPASRVSIYSRHQHISSSMNVQFYAQFTTNDYL